MYFNAYYISLPSQLRTLLLMPLWDFKGKGNVKVIDDLTQPQKAFYMLAQKTYNIQIHIDKFRAEKDIPCDL